MLDSTRINRASNLRRLGYCLLPLLLGAGGALVLLLAAGGPAYADTLTFPGCGVSIQACIDSANPGDTIVISAGDYTESLTLSQAVSLTGELSSTTILHALPNSRVLTVTGAAVDSSVVISGLTFTGGNVTGTLSCPDSCGGGILITGTAQPRLSNLRLVSNTAEFSGGGVYAHDALTLTSAGFLSNTAGFEGGGAYAAGDIALTQVLFQANQCLGSACISGGGIFVSGAAVVTGSQFIGNIVNALGAFHNTDGGGLYAGGNLALAGSTFSGNSAVSAGGGLYTAGNSAITSSTFSNNSASGGGGIFNSAALAITGATLTGNQAYRGGGLYSYGTVTLTGSTVTSNTAGSDGGGAYNFGNLAITDSVISNNNGGYRGGGLYNTGNLTLTSSTLSGNAGYYGGGLYNDNGGQYYNNGGISWLFNSTVSSNTATGQGGGVYNYYGSLAIAASTVSNNQALMGGGVWQCCPGYMSLISSSVSSNTATAGDGGGLYADGYLFISSSTISGNTAVGASHRGGGIFSAGTLIGAGSTISNNTADDGGGLFDLFGPMTLSSTAILNNAAAYGGAVFIQSYYASGDNQLVNDLVAGNTASQEGAALYVDTPDRAEVVHTTIASPTPGNGAAIVVVSGTVGVTDTIIASYTTGISLTAGSVFQDYNLFFGNSTNTTGAVSGGSHSLTGDPAFVSPAGGDYHIGSGSAAIDTGTDAGVSTDIDGDPRPQGAGFDIGYDEIPLLAALPDAYSTPLNTSLLVLAPGVLGNDTTLDLNPLTAVLVQAPLTGTLDLAADGSATYTAPLGFAGLVTFTYQAVDNGHFSAPALVMLVIGNLPPLAVAGTGQVKTAGQLVTLDGSGSSDPENYLPLTFGWHQSGGPGVVLSSATISRPTFTAPGAPAVLTFTLTVSDAYGLASLPATTTVTVTDQAISGLLAAGGTPRALGSSTPFTATISAGTNVTYAWGFGDGSAPGSGALASHTYALPGAFQAVVTATNSVGQVTATTTVTVDDTPLAASDIYTTAEDTPLQVPAPGVLANDSDVYPGGLVAQLASGPSTGLLALAASGRFTYTAPANFHGLVTFTYRASDGLFSSPPATVTITVTPVNDPPTLTTPVDVTTTAGTPVGPLSFSIGDVDGDPLTVTAHSSNTALLPNDGLVLGGSGAALTVTLTPSADMTGTTTITLSVSDGLVTTARTFILTVTSAERKLYLPLVLR